MVRAHVGEPNMKLEYYYSEEKVYERPGDAIPSVGHMVYLDEIFFVENVVWYPKDSIVRVYLSDRQVASKKPVAERKQNVVNLGEVRQIKETADKALKESATLRREVSSIRQFLKTQPKAPTKNDT